MALTVYSLYERHQASKKGEYLFVDRSSFLHDGRMITLKRYSMHAFFAEYKRVLVVDQRDGTQVTSELMSDSGGSSDIEICRSAAGELVMQDRLTAHLINVDGTVRELSTQSATDMSSTFPVNAPKCVAKVGRFGPIKDEYYGFIPEPVTSEGPSKS